MQICRTVEEIKNFVQQERLAGKNIGLVPTMGYFHEGHLQLMKTAKKNCQTVVVSIFVNPIQFCPGEDFEQYPRNLQRDCQMAETVGVEAVFCPVAEEMYPQGFTTYIDFDSLTNCLCGKSRPGHFRGVATVVTKLFHIVWPDKAFFGQKDAQQLMIIRRMAEDLNMPVEIHGVPIVREADGLAMSSRNAYLTPLQRQKAPVLYQGLQAAAEAVKQGERSAAKVIQVVAHTIASVPEAQVEYIEIRDLDLQSVEILTGTVLLALAVRFNQTRLIDNMILEV